MHSNWKRVGLGACTATAVALTAGLAMAPAAQAATTPTGGLLGGVTSTLTGVTNAVTGTTTTPTTGSLTGTVTDLLNGLLNGTASTSGSPVTLNTSNGTIGVGVGTGSGIGLSIGSTGNGTAVTANVTGGTPAATTTTTGGEGTTTPTTTGTAPAVTGLRITSSVDTVYPVKDGYRDAVVLHVVGTTASGAEQPVAGVVVVKRGSTEVKRWTISRSTQDLTWDGRSNGKVVAGAYTVTGVEVDATGAAVAATDALSVSAKRLVTATSIHSSTSVSGVHTMSGKARAGLTKGEVLLRITTTASGVVGKQYLRFTHKGKTVKVRIANGTHTSKAVTVPKSFTTYRISHTWKTGTVTLSSVKYKYTYKKLK